MTEVPWLVITEAVFHRLEDVCRVINGSRRKAVNSYKVPLFGFVGI